MRPGPAPLRPSSDVLNPEGAVVFIKDRTLTLQFLEGRWHHRVAKRISNVEAVPQPVDLGFKSYSA